MSGGRQIAVDCVLSFMAIALTAAIAYYLQMSQNANSSMDLSSVTQIKDDWQTPALTEIKITDDKYCPAGMASIWTKMWGGTVQGCDCSNVWNMSAWKHHLQVDDRCMDDDEYQCYYEPPRSAVIQEEINDVYICGRRDGSTFAQAVRPNASGACPSGHAPCSQNTSPANTICYEVSKGKTKCPITGIQFVDDEDKIAWISEKWRTKSETWEKMEFDDDQVLVYTKDANALPVTSTKLEYAPCMNPNQVSVSPGQVFYALENDVNNGCKPDLQSGRTNDDRYLRTGFKTTEYDIQDDSNAWDTMEYMASFNPQNQKQLRKSQPLYAWTRPAIEWDLSCESNAKTTRDVVMWTFSHPFSMPGRVAVALGFAYTVLALEVVCLCCAGGMAMKEGEYHFMTGGRAIATGCGCCFMIFVVWMLATAVGMQDANVQTLDNYKIVNDCSDAYTHVKVEELTPIINKSTDNLKTASFISYGLLAIYTIAACVVAKQTNDGL